MYDFSFSFQRNMREAHAMYPFTGKRDKELFDKALAEVCGFSILDFKGGLKILWCFSGGASLFSFSLELGVWEDKFSESFFKFAAIIKNNKIV